MSELPAAAKAVLILLLALATVSCDSSLPPILRNVSAGGGWASGCTQPTFMSVKSPLALSPELDARLKESYPPGTVAAELAADLSEWGFVLAEPCDEDPTIKRAYYQEPEGWIVFMPLTANVYWKVDQSGRLEWTMGFVAFSGL